MPRQPTIPTTPPLALLKALVPELAEPARELAELKAEAAAASNAAREAEAALKQAKEHDIEAAAVHARQRKGTKLPTLTAPKARDQAEEAAMRAEALNRAVAGCAADLEAETEKHRDVALERLADEGARLLAESQAAVGELESAEAARAELAALQRWLHGQVFSPGKSVPPVLDLRGMNGDPYRLDTALQAIGNALAKLAEPEPAREAAG